MSKERILLLFQVMISTVALSTMFILGYIQGNRKSLENCSKQYTNTTEHVPIIIIKPKQEQKNL